jgi:hypothetical protein
MRSFRVVYASPDIVRVIKSRRMRRAEHVARMGSKNIYEILALNPEVKRPLERLRS